MQDGFKCNRGVVRKNNEDACFIIPSHKVYLVADGVGGNNSGEVASNTAVEEIAKYIKGKNLEDCEGPEEIFGLFTEAIDIANSEIYKMGKEQANYKGMATTLVTTYIRDDAAYFSNVGDSRAYLFRNGRLKRITKDHTYVNELVDKGVISEMEAETHSQKNVITKALGAEPLCEPDFYRVRLVENDIVLLCSDGLYGEIGDSEMAEMLKRAVAHGTSMHDLCADFVDEAILSGGRDNITVVTIRI